MADGYYRQQLISGGGDTAHIAGLTHGAPHDEHIKVEFYLTRKQKVDYSLCSTEGTNTVHIQQMRRMNMGKRRMKWRPDSSTNHQRANGERFSNTTDGISMQC